jgi:hypothetical protein
MTIASVKRWQWVLASLAIGLALWGARRWNADDLGRFGDAMNDPLRFETALTREVAGFSAFKDVSVHRERLDDGAGAAKAVHVVTGRYCDGQVDPHDGKYHWQPTVFIAPIPYRPASYLPDLLPIEAVERFEALPHPTVIDLFEALADERGIAYTHAWWDTYPALTRVGGSVVLIGVVWPTIVNLLVFGRLVRPREPRGIDLSAAAPAPPMPAARGPTDAELEQLRRLEQELAARLAVDAPSPAIPDVSAMPAPAELSGESLEPAAAAAREDRTFAAKPDDYYPTERRAGASHNGRAPPPQRVAGG